MTSISHSLPQMPWVGYKVINGKKSWFKKNRDGFWIEFNQEDKEFYLEQYPHIFAERTTVK